jgi:hypothetical protein
MHGWFSIRLKSVMIEDLAPRVAAGQFLTNPLRTAGRSRGMISLRNFATSTSRHSAVFGKELCVARPP